MKPQNTVALVGDRVVLRCSTNSSGGNDSLIEWTFGTERPSCVCNLVIDSVAYVPLTPELTTVLTEPEDLIESLYLP